MWAEFTDAFLRKQSWPLHVISHFADGDRAQKGKRGHCQLEQEEEEEQDPKAVVQEQAELEDGSKGNDE